MRSFLTTTKLLVDDDVFLSSLSSLPRSFCALLLLSMLTLMPSSSASARTTTGCSFGVVCVRYECVFILFFCVCVCLEPPEECLSVFFLNLSRPQVKKRRCAFFAKKKKTALGGRCATKSSNSTLLITTHGTVHSLLKTNTHTHTLHIYTHIYTHTEDVGVVFEHSDSHRFHLN